MVFGEALGDEFEREAETRKDRAKGDKFGLR
jgi:hypothetical protein